MRILIVSNLDSVRPFGQFLRPFHLGAGLAAGDMEVGTVGVDCSAVRFGPSWSTSRKSLARLARAAVRARRSFRPDVIYGHELRGGMAAIVAAGSVPVVADFHSVPSMEWRGYAEDSPALSAARYRLAALRAAALERVIVARARRVIAAGDEVADLLRRRHGLEERPAVVGNGVSPDVLKEVAEGPPSYGSGLHAVTAVPGAQSVSNARALDFLRAVARDLHAGQPKVTIHVLGSEGEDEGDTLRFEGFQPSIASWLSHADVCLLPYPSEAALYGGARNKLLEGLSAARAVVTTREGLRGLRDAAGWPGVTVTADDPRRFAEAVRAAALPEAPTLLARREAIRAQLHWETQARAAAAVLAESLAAAGS